MPNRLHSIMISCLVKEKLHLVAMQYIEDHEKLQEIRRITRDTLSE